MDHKRINRRFGKGEYYFPSPGDSSRERDYAAPFFLDAVYRLAPQFVAAVVNEIEPVYNVARERRFGTQPSNRRGFQQLDTLQDVMRLAVTNDDFGNLESALVRLASKYHLECEVVYTGILRFLARRYQSSPLSLQEAWTGFNLEIRDDGSMTPTILSIGFQPSPYYKFFYEDEDGEIYQDEAVLFKYYTHWDPQDCSESEFKRQAISEFKEQLDEFVVEVKQHVEQLGLKPVTIRREILTNFERLIHRRVLKKNYAQIQNLEAQHVPSRQAPSESAILKGIKQAADLIGLPIRKRN